MTKFTSEAGSSGIAVSAGGSLVLGVDTSGVPILGLTVTSATSVQSAGNNAFVKARAADGTLLWLIARTSAP
jgi:hypothetical protein